MYSMYSCVASAKNHSDGKKYIEKCKVGDNRCRAPVLQSRPRVALAHVYKPGDMLSAERVHDARGADLGRGFFFSPTCVLCSLSDPDPQQHHIRDTHRVADPIATRGVQHLRRLASMDTPAKCQHQLLQIHQGSFGQRHDQRHWVLQAPTWNPKMRDG